MNSSETVFLPSDRDATGRSLGKEELELLGEAIAGGNLFCVPGNMVPRFEREFAELYGVSHARAVTSGTAAVHTALGALDIAPGDEVVTTPITDMGAITPILFQGAIPVHADVDPDTLNVTASTSDGSGPARRRRPTGLRWWARPLLRSAMRWSAEAGEEGSTDRRRHRTGSRLEPGARTA